MNGIINVYKEKGFTSHDVVAKLRGILHMKKIGHTGTLDPDAVGVLPVCVGKATKVCDLLMDKDKTYLAEVKLGVTTDTLDLSGEVLSEREVSVTEEELQHIIPEFTGTIMQIPPMYSAIKVNGKRLYELARKGQEVERKPRPVTIHSLILRSVNLTEGEFSIEVNCSKGTYIRTLCADIGERLGCGAAMKSLVRTKVGQFYLEDALKLSEIEEQVKKQGGIVWMKPVDSVFSQYARLEVQQSGMKMLENGNKLKLSQGTVYSAEGEIFVPKPDMYVRAYGAEGDFYAIYQYDAKEKMFHIVKMFHESRN